MADLLSGAAGREYGRDVDELICPRCQGELVSRPVADARIRRCEGCGALFLERVDLGALIEAENDWHHHQSANTAAMPRITPGMTEPPPAPARSRAFLEVLFRS